MHRESNLNLRGKHLDLGPRIIFPDKSEGGEFVKWRADSVIEFLDLGAALNVSWPGTAEDSKFRQLAEVGNVRYFPFSAHANLRESSGRFSDGAYHVLFCSRN